jgi:hypothetical protein
LPPEPSPSTPPPSLSPLLSPMMRRDWSSSPPRLSALPVAMWFISLSHGVIFM